MTDQETPNEPPRERRTVVSRGGGGTAIAIVAVVAIVALVLIFMFNGFGGEADGNGGLLEVPTELGGE